MYVFIFCVVSGASGSGCLCVSVCVQVHWCLMCMDLLYYRSDTFCMYTYNYDSTVTPDQMMNDGGILTASDVL